ncbi:MAG: flagellar hook-length control protein FliK [Lachnospiraceae bacterium]|nr:flagellar hook-length control protein FliK [Lachnospiraceae bacterium]
MNLGNIFQAFTQGVRQPDMSSGASGTYAAGERNYQALSENKIVPGQTIQGEVVGKEGNTVQIALDSETVLTARLERDLNIALGQNLSFEVRAGNGSQLSLLPLYANMANGATILKALAAAGLPESVGNMKMVSDMMQEGMPIDRDSIANMNRQLLDFPNANPSSIMQMIRLGMPINAENIEQFELYKNYEHQILQSAHDIMEELPQTYMELISEGKDNEAVAFYEQIIKALIGGDGEGIDGEVLVKTAAGEAEAAGENAAAGEAAKNASESAEGLTEIVKNAQDGTQGDTANFVQNGVKDEASAEVLKATSDGETLNETGQGKAAEDVAAKENVQEAVADKSHISQSTWRELGDMLQKLGTDTELAKQVAEGELTPKETLSHINDLIAANTNLFKEGFHESLKNLFGSRPFQNLLQAEMTNEWLLKPEEVAYKENVEKLYERIKEQTAKMSEAFQMADKADSAGAKSVNNLQSNVDFMNQMNQLFTYVQLPLKMAGNEAHGDLYVYTNKKSLAKKDGNVSALLHLDMENLGPLDVYVTMNTSQNKVSTNFTLKDDAALDLIAENIHILNERLEKRGYSMKANFKIKGEEEPEETNIMEEIIKQSKNISVLSRTSFDMRA